MAARSGPGVGKDPATKRGSRLGDQAAAEGGAAAGDAASGLNLLLQQAADVLEGAWRRAADSDFNVTAEMLDPLSVARQLRDQMTLAKCYIVLAKENSNFQMAWELSNQVRAGQLLFSQAATQAKSLTSSEAAQHIKKFASLIYEAKELRYDCAGYVMHLKAHSQMLEEKATAASIQSTFFGQLAAEAIPKGLHCLGMRLTTEWAHNLDLRQRMLRNRESPKLTDNNLYHFCIFSDNVLATSVVVNSTMSHAHQPEMFVFHIVTDNMNYGAMQTWFAINLPDRATVDIRNVDDFAWLNASYVPVLRQLQSAETRSYYFKASLQDPKGTIKFRNPKYLAILNHLRFYIPEVYPHLKKVIFLDDDVVIQRDLTALFQLDLQGNVNGAVETCLENFHRFHKYLNFSHPEIKDNFDPDACGWAFGMNVFDLDAWKKANVTGIYHYWQERNADRLLWKLGTLPPGLLTFYGLTQPLERWWHVLGLGYDPNVDLQVISRAAVLHWNGNMKPWLKLAMPQYRPLWLRYLNLSDPFIGECNMY
eukprot:SM000050S16959  [mRNA]  locus=s50:61550:64836:- [translate_table: standard]